jgi:hypothetical protein
MHNDRRIEIFELVPEPDDDPPVKWGWYGTGTGRVSKAISTLAGLQPTGFDIADSRVQVSEAHVRELLWMAGLSDRPPNALPADVAAATMNAKIERAIDALRAMQSVLREIAAKSQEN